LPLRPFRVRRGGGLQIMVKKSSNPNQCSRILLFKRDKIENVETSWKYLFGFCCKSHIKVASFFISVLSRPLCTCCGLVKGNLANSQNSFENLFRLLIVFLKATYTLFTYYSTAPTIAIIQAKKKCKGTQYVEAAYPLLPLMPFSKQRRKWKGI